MTSLCTSPHACNNVVLKWQKGVDLLRKAANAQMECNLDRASHWLNGGITGKEWFACFRFIVEYIGEMLFKDRT